MTNINRSYRAILIAATFVLLMVMGCGKTADSYSNLLDEYKNVACKVMHGNASMTERTAALNRQLELNNEIKAAVESLSNEERAKFLMKQAQMLAEVADGKCH